MFKGTMIDELIATVKRAEDRAHEAQFLLVDERPTYYYALPSQETTQFELAGVA